MQRYGLMFRMRALVRGRASDALARHERPEHLVEAVVDHEQRTVRELTEVYVEAQAQRARLEHQLEQARTEADKCTTAAEQRLAAGDEPAARALLLRAVVARRTVEDLEPLLAEQDHAVARLEADTQTAAAAMQLRAAHAALIATTARHARLADHHARIAYGDDRHLPADHIFADAQADAASHAARAEARRRLGMTSAPGSPDLDLHLAQASVDQQLWQLRHGAADALPAGQPSQPMPDKES